MRSFKDCILCPFLCELTPWANGAVSWSSGPRCERSGQDLHWPETERRSSDTRGFAFSEQKMAEELSFVTPLHSRVINSPDSDITNLWYVCASRHKCTMCSCTNNSRSGHWLTPSASSTTGTGVALRLETTSLSPQLLALTKYWSEGTA